MDIENDTTETVEVRVTPLTLEDAARMALNALDAALNLEGVAKVGASFAVWDGLDVAAHYDRVRAAIEALEAVGLARE